MAKAIAIKDKVDLERIKTYLKENNEKAYILFIIGLATGYRGSDLIRLTVKDAKNAIKEKKFVVIEEKVKNIKENNKRKNNILRSKKKCEVVPRIAYIPDKLIMILEEYCNGKSEAAYLYPSQKGQGEGEHKEHIRRDSLGKIFKKVAVTCGLVDKCIGTHTPRKTYGYIQYHAHNEDINFVQELFGHTRASITRRYIGIDEEEKEASAEVMNDYI